MKVTVKECLELPVFGGVRVLAGENRLQNEVERVSVLEGKNPECVLEQVETQGQLMITRNWPEIKTGKDQVAIIENLAKTGVSALGIFVESKKSFSLKEEVIQVAKREGVPLLFVELKENTDLGKIIEEITSKLFYGNDVDDGSKLINNTIYHLLNFEKYASFPEAIKGAAVNNDFQTILLSKELNPIFSVETRHRTTISEAIRIGRKETNEWDNSHYIPIDVNGVLTYWGQVTIEGEKYFMLIVDNEDSYSPFEVAKLAEIIELAMGMWKFTPKRDVRVEFVKALRRGNLTLAHSLKNEMDMGTGTIISVFYTQGITEARGRALLAREKDEEKTKAFFVHEEEETHGIIVGESSDKGLNTEIIRFFEELGEDPGITIFHVTGIDGIEGAGDGYRLIGETCSFAKHVFPYKSVLTRYELTLLSNCINIQLQGGYMKKNYLELLDGIKSLGENKGRQLLETLETFVLDAGSNGNETGRIMGIHANTVQYRLKTINELLGIDLVGNGIVPGITIALALKRLERVVV